MEEQKLEIIENGQYKNLNLKSKPSKGIVGLTDGNYIIVEKVYAEGLEVVSKIYKKADGVTPAVSYSCGVIYNGEECSFWLTESEHDLYKEVGGEGDKIKIILYKEAFVNKKDQEVIAQKLKFEAVE